MFKALVTIVQNQICVKSVVETDDGFQVIFPILHHNTPREIGVQLGVWDVNGKISTTTAFYQNEGDDFNCSYFSFQDEMSTLRSFESFLPLQAPSTFVEDLSNVANIIQELLLCIKLNNAISPSAANALTTLH